MRRASAVLALTSLLLGACASDDDASADTADTPSITAPEDSADDSLLVPDDERDADRLTDAGPSDPSDPSDQSVPEAHDDADPAVLPDGFTTAMVEITEADGTVCEVCMWLADSASERGQGLMGVTALGTPAAMAFVWEEPTAGGFFMFQTVTPLSIAWFGAPDGDGDGDAGGELVSTTDMEPCLAENSATCERFFAGGDYVLAIEVFQGDLASIGITEGATARLLPGSEAADCPLT